MPLLRQVRLALAFLTILPVGPAPVWRADDGPRIVLGFPFVGLLLGGLLWISAPWLTMHLRPEAAGVAMAMLIVALTGAMHLDGLCDVADAAFAEKPPAERRRIARDPHLGAYGFAVGAFYLLGLVAACRPPLDPMAFAVAPVLARTLIIPWLSFGQLGEGSRFAAALRPSAAVALTATAMGLAAVVGLFVTLGGHEPVLPLWPLVGAVAVVVLVGAWLVQRLGGFSGDIAGALIALGEWAVIGLWP